MRDDVNNVPDQNDRADQRPCDTAAGDGAAVRVSDSARTWRRRSGRHCGRRRDSGLSRRNFYRGKIPYLATGGLRLGGLLAHTLVSVADGPEMSLRTYRNSCYVSFVG